MSGRMRGGVDPQVKNKRERATKIVWEEREKRRRETLVKPPRIDWAAGDREGEGASYEQGIKHREEERGRRRGRKRKRRRVEGEAIRMSFFSSLNIGEEIKGGRRGRG